MISIIITAYNNPKYIDECLKSVIKSCGDNEFEILLGIDNCQLTLSSVMSKYEKYKNLKVCFFEKRVGTYIIRNSLLNHTNYETVLFFDSDDIMKQNMISDILYHSQNYDIVKPMFSGFKDGDNINLEKFNTQKNTFGEGVFAIKKTVFLEANGFEPWICAADSEFNWRLRMNNKTFKYLDRVSFYYRRHSESLTTNSETGMRSKLRMKYHILTKNKKNTKLFKPLEKMVTNDFIVLDEYNSENYLITTTISENTLDIKNIEKEKNNTIIHTIFNREPKKLTEIKIREKTKVLSNNPLFEILTKSNKSKDPNSLKEEIIVKKREIVQEVKQKTNKQIYQELHPSKPNRRLDLPKLRL